MPGWNNGYANWPRGHHGNFSGRGGNFPRFNRPARYFQNHASTDGGSRGGGGGGRRGARMGCPWPMVPMARAPWRPPIRPGPLYTAFLRHQGPRVTNWNQLSPAPAQSLDFDFATPACPPTALNSQQPSPKVQIKQEQEEQETGAASDTTSSFDTSATSSEVQGGGFYGMTPPHDEDGEGELPRKGRKRKRQNRRRAAKLRAKRQALSGAAATGPTEGSDEEKRQPGQPFASAAAAATVHYTTDKSNEEQLPSPQQWEVLITSAENPYHPLERDSYDKFIDLVHTKILDATTKAEADRRHGCEAGALKIDAVLFDQPSGSGRIRVQCADSRTADWVRHTFRPLGLTLDFVAWLYGQEPALQPPKLIWYTTFLRIPNVATTDTAENSELSTSELMTALGQQNRLNMCEWKAWADAPWWPSKQRRYTIGVPEGRDGVDELEARGGWLYYGIDKIQLFPKMETDNQRRF